MKIHYENDTELAEFEAFYKEYRRDVVVEKKRKKISNTRDNNYKIGTRLCAGNKKWRLFSC